MLKRICPRLRGARLIFFVRKLQQREELKNLVEFDEKRQCSESAKCNLKVNVDKVQYK